MLQLPALLGVDAQGMCSLSAALFECLQDQCRRVILQGCVSSREESAELERIVRLIDDVESVINELMAGTEGAPPYRMNTTLSKK